MADHLLEGHVVSDVEMVRPLIRLFYGTGETIQMMQRETAQSQKERPKVPKHWIVTDCVIVVKIVVERQQERRTQLSWRFSISQPVLGG